MLLSNSAILASPEKSLASIASRHKASRRGASATRPAWSGLDVARAWPSVDPTALEWRLTTAIRSTNSQWSGPAIASEYESGSSTPVCHSTNPPNIDRQADHDPSLAMRERSLGER